MAPPHSYDPWRKYDPDYDVRDWQALARRFSQPSDGVFWPLLGARRSGKTWALKALARHFGDDGAFIDLRKFDLERPLSAAHDRGVLLLDEPGPRVFVSPAKGQAHEHLPNKAAANALLRWCVTQQQAGKTLVMALTPAEWTALREAEIEGGFLADNELQAGALTQLSAAQAQGLARDELGRRTLAALRARQLDWARNPFLLTLALYVASEAGDSDPPLDATISKTIRAANKQFQYAEKVLREGLNRAQQQELEAVASGHEGELLHCELLESAGLLSKEEGRFRIADPVLAHELPPPLRIHHLSDLHFGSKTALRVDAKAQDAAGRALAEAAGQAPVRDDYRKWIESLPRARRPHLLVISGDLAEWGQAQEFAECRAWLEQLERSLAAHPDLDDDDPRILLVGGNHDVDWTQTWKAGCERHQILAKAFEDAPWPRPRLEQAPQARKGEHVHIRYRRASLEFALLGSAERGGEQSFDAELIKLVESLREQVLQERELWDDPVRASDMQRLYAKIDPGLVHDADIQRLRKHEWVEAIRVAVLHHPLSQFSTTTEVAPYAGLLNAGQIKDALLEQRFLLALHGHVHSPWIGEERWPGRHQGRGLTTVSVATLGSRETYETHGFNELRIARVGRQRWIQIQPFEHRGQGFVADGAVVEIEVSSTLPAPVPAPA